MQKEDVGRRVLSPLPFTCATQRGMGWCRSVPIESYGESLSKAGAVVSKHAASSTAY
jgi:hypothetical protein